MTARDKVVAPLVQSVGEIGKHVQDAAQKHGLEMSGGERFGWVLRGGNDSKKQYKNMDDYPKNPRTEVTPMGDKVHIRGVGYNYPDDKGFSTKKHVLNKAEIVENPEMLHQKIQHMLDGVREGL